jgi:hypothetical protein
MMEIFRGPRLKVRRANQHIQELEAWLAGINQGNVDAARRHKEGNPGAASDALYMSRPAGYADCVAPIVGDVAHNLRAPLDLIASNILVASGKDPENPPMYFPLSDTREALVKTGSYRRIEAISADVALFIADSIKPYKAANYPLWALNRLDRMDKHRLLVPTMARASHLIIAIKEEHEDNPPPDAAPGSIFMLGGITKADGTVAQVAREPRPGSAAWLHNQRNGYSTVNLCFGKGEVFEDRPIIPTLKQLSELVTGIIDTLEAFIESD